MRRRQVLGGRLACILQGRVTDAGPSRPAQPAVGRSQRPSKVFNQPLEQRPDVTQSTYVDIDNTVYLGKRFDEPFRSEPLRKRPE